MEDNLPVYKFVIGDDTSTGMKAISLVEEGAIESEFQLFSKDKPQFIVLKDESGEYKQHVLGAVLRPDIKIFRRDNDGREYYGIFEKDTIVQIRDKFHKEKNTSNVNLDHDAEKSIDAFLIESYIIESETQLEAVKELGIEDIELGAWIARYKVESSELFELIVNGDVNVNGFSIEAFLNKEVMEELSKQKNNFKQKTNLMPKFNELIDRFKAVIDEFSEEDTTSTESTESTELEDVTVADSDIILRYTEVDQPVLQVTVDEEGEESTVAVEAGEYILEDGRTLVVDEEGNLTEIKEGEEEPAPAAEEELEEEDKVETPASTEEKLEEEEDTSTSETTSDLDKTVSELIPVDKDGSYQLEVYVSDGKISYGTLYAWTYSDLKLAEVTSQFEELKTDKAELDTKVENLEQEMKKPVGNPVFTELKSETKVGKNKEDFKNNLEYTLNRLGLDSE